MDQESFSESKFFHGVFESGNKSKPPPSVSVSGFFEMKDDDTLPTTTAIVRKQSSDSTVFGKGRYKFWALAAILLLAFWSIFTGTVTLRWSAGNLNRLSDDLDSPIHDDLDVLVSDTHE